MKQSYFLTVRDQFKLYHSIWDVANPKATILIVHGYAEHIERYHPEAAIFNAAGYRVVGYDHRAHGRSDGADGYMDTFEELCLDLQEVIRYLNPDTPLYIYGHSVGALVSLKYLLDVAQDSDTNIEGFLFTGAALKVAEDLSPLLQKFSSLLGRLVPRLKTIRLPIDGISKVPEVQADYENDPYNYRGGIYASSGYQILKATKEISARLEEVTYPFLAMHGGDDSLIEKEGSINLFEKASSIDKELKIWEGLGHEITRSYSQEQVLGQMISWLNQRLELKGPIKVEHDGQ